jgi:aminoglycoside phosphotransferase (APT) family kinase protein
VASAGTVHVLYRLGTDMLVRLPRRRWGTEGPDGHLLDQLAQRVPVPIPSTIAVGQPSAEYPYEWSVVRWLDGETPVEGDLANPGLLAADLAEFLKALWSIDLAGGPPAYRGGPLATRNEFTLDAIDRVHGLVDTESARFIWDHAVRLPSWHGPDTWIHADLMPGNVLIGNDRLAGVIDFECSGIGDPAQDLIVAWMLLPAQVRPDFRRAVDADDATWFRGRARALSMALGHLDYYKDSNQVMAANARYTIREVLADYYAANQTGVTDSVAW